MSMRRRLVAWPGLILLGITVFAGIRGRAAVPAPAVGETEARLRHDVTFLASDECEGRGVTTEGIRKAADFIANEFRKAHLKPGGVDGTYFQPFTIPGAVLDAPAAFALRGPKGQVVTFKQGTDFYPMALGHAGTVSGLPAVFAGYGITSEKDPEYDDYADLDVADKVVIVLSDAPRSPGAKTAAVVGAKRRKELATFASKIASAEKHHAAALVVVNDAATAGTGDDLLDFNYMALATSRAGIPVLHAHRRVLESMLPGGADELRGIERDIDRDLKPHSRELEGWSISLTVKMRRDKIALKNVIGVLDGVGPLAQETVVIGAHYDHLGYGGPFGRESASLAGLKKMAIHHGADDNGSGTASVLELARRFGESPPEGPRRRMVFMTFSGEEIALLGSDHYTKHPVFPLNDTVAMVNLDMVGRLRPDKETKQDKLLIEGSGTAKTFDELLNEVNRKYNFKLVKKPSGYGPSDHASFYMKKVPVLFCWTDYHEDYHRPSDTADKINVPGMRKVVDFAGDLIKHLVTVEQRPEYVEVKGGNGPHAGEVPRLGVLFDYGAADEDKGVLLSGVTADGPAAKAGMKAGDLIVEVAGKPVKNLTSYMTTMSTQKKTGTLELVVERAGKRVPIKVQLD